MSQALLEKCLHLDMSISTSDEEEANRLSKVHFEYLDMPEICFREPLNVTKV